MKKKHSQEEIQKYMRGRIYCNSNDTNIFVKRKGVFSYTMNLGNKWSWVLMGLMLLIVLILLLIFN